MQDIIIAILVLIVLFVGFGLSHRRGQKRAPVCPGCTGCKDKSECTKEDAG